MVDRSSLCVNFVDYKLTQIKAQAMSGHTKASLAKLRRGVGKSPAATPELWSLVLEGMPEELYSKDKEPSVCEMVVHTVLTLFSLHQQGKDISEQFVHKRNISLGKAIRMLISDENEEARIKRRFDAVVTSNDITEVAQHLRGLIQIMRSKNISLDYVQLAKDLYWFSFEESRDSVRLGWGRDFYFRNKNDDNQKDEMEE